jgi:hypothetical protein
MAGVGVGVRSKERKSGGEVYKKTIMGLTQINIAQ